jgi:hypothetical protein
MPLALFGIEDGGLNAAVNVLILFLVIVWLALAYWTWADARRRIDDSILVTTAAVLGLVPFLGPIIYTILRPPEFLEDRHERELEMKAAELRLRHLTDTSCPRCEHPIERNWLRCPECSARLKDPCRSCGRPVDPRWSVCPHCETQLAGARRSRSRSEGRAPARRSAEPKQRQSSSSRAAGARAPQKRSGSSSASRSAEESSRGSRTAQPKRRSSSPSSGSGASPREPGSSPRSSSGKQPKPRPSGAEGEGERPSRRPTTRS